jgi:hypothetical protein
MTRHQLFVYGGAFLLGCLVSAAMASAQIADYSISAGYSHFHPQTNGGLFFDRDGPYLDADFAFRVPDPRSPLQLGFGLTGSGYFESQNYQFPFNNNTIAETNLDSDVDFFEIEPRVGLQFWLPGGFFFKPRLGAGLLINNYSIDTASTNNNTTIFNTDNHTGAAFEIRPAIQGGYTWGPAAFGIELSYMWAWGSFGALGDRAGEFRAGAFFTFRY